MKLHLPFSPRTLRHVKHYQRALLAALAAMALAACGNERVPGAPASSIAKGVQQILQSSGEAAAVSLQSNPGKSS